MIIKYCDTELVATLLGHVFTSYSCFSNRVFCVQELESPPIKEEPAYVAPMSVQPTRKNKCSSLNMAALQRL